MAKLDVVIPAVEVEVNGVRYRKVDREAKAGDIIKATERSLDVTKDAFYAVYEDERGVLSFDDDYSDKRDFGGLYFEVYEKVAAKQIAQPRPLKPARLTVGDYAKVVDASGDGSAKVGDIGVVVNDNWGGAGFGNLTVIEVETFDGRKIGMFASRFICATEAEVAAARKAVDRAKAVGEFADGGYAQIKAGADGYFNRVPAGSYVQVRVTKVPGPYALELALADGVYAGYSNADALRKITKEEYEAEIARKAEEAKWTKIGRKVNEYKRGDIVQYVDNSEEIAVVKSATERTVTVRTAEFGICTEGFHAVKLIVPVEQRFDTKEAA